MNENNALVEVEGGWTWADTELAQEARKEFESVLYSMTSDKTAKLLSKVMSEALGADVDGEGVSGLLVDIIVKAVRKLESDAAEHWSFIRECAGLDELTQLKYNWPNRMFSIVEPSVAIAEDGQND